MEQCMVPANGKRMKPNRPKPPQTPPKPAYEPNGNIIQGGTAERSPSDQSPLPKSSPKGRPPDPPPKPSPEDLNATVRFSQQKKPNLNNVQENNNEVPSEQQPSDKHPSLSGNKEDKEMGGREKADKNQNLGILKGVMKKVNPFRSTVQMDAETSQSEHNDDQREETDNQQVCDRHGPEEGKPTRQEKGGLVGMFWKVPKEKTPTFTSYIADTNSEMGEDTSENKVPDNTQVSTESRPEPQSEEPPQKPSSTDTKELKGPENKQNRGGVISGMFWKSEEKVSSRVSSLGNELEFTDDISREEQKAEHIQEKGGVFSGMFRRSPKPAEPTPPVQDNQSVHGEPSKPQGNLSDSIPKEIGGMLSGMFRKSPKPSEGSAPAQDNLSTHSELSASNDSLTDNNTKKGGMLSGMFRKSPKPVEPTLPVQDTLSAHSELSASNDSLTDSNTKEKGGMLSGMFRRSPKPAEQIPPVQDKLSTHSELSASNDSLTDNNTTKEKGGMLSGLFRKSPKPSEGSTPAQDNLSTHSELSASNDSLTDSNTKDSLSVHSELSASNDNLTDSNNTKEKGGMLSGMFRRSPKPAERTLPVQDNLSTHSELSASNDSLTDSNNTKDNLFTFSELSASNDSLTDNNTKGKGGMLSGMFRKAPKPAEQTPPVQVSVETEGETGGQIKRGRSLGKKKRVVSFRVKRTLPRTPRALFQSTKQDSEEEEDLIESVEMEELSPVQESSVEIQMVEMAPFPSEGNPLDSEEESDSLLEWWRTVEGWDEWNESSNFKEDEEDLAVEQAADRVYLAAQLFVRLFNQRGASLQQRILELLAVADAADNFHKRTVAASMGGRVASVVGSVTTITGLVLAPFTFGASIIVTAVGIGVATAGSITSASANITDTVHSNMDRKKVEKMIQGYQEEIKDIRECLEFVQEGMDALQEWNFEKYTESLAKRALNQNVKHVVKEGARAGKALMINTDQLISTVQVLSVAGGAAKAAQAISVTTGVMSALFLALDIFFLAKDSHELRKGAKTQFATKIREVCKDLQDGLLELNRVKTDLQKTMDGIELEEYEEEEEEEEEEDEEEESDLESDPKKLALLEEEIDQLEEELDQRAQEKKKGEGERGEERRRGEGEILAFTEVTPR
ncbi:hypothetical protein MATL_G00251840 [Megalops atlanticus]|uniref:Uncharacterized protein n=1 Tax=Megalops atlanticus TaxID=7932 RepID=A0A9D3PDM1_MEGAT|nr:hypothetical protein MATL_G00251840 [Megalops atlanticus]